MSVYIDAGYVAALGSLALYGSSLLVRERNLRRRVGSLQSDDAFVPIGEGEERQLSAETTGDEEPEQSQ
jgi:hypothetical protein